MFFTDVAGRLTTDKKGTPVKLSDLQKLYVAEHPRGIRPTTAKYLVACVQCFSSHLGREATTDDLNRACVNTYVDWMLVNRAPSTMRSQRCGLLMLWRFAADAGYADSPARVRCPKRTKRPVETWTKEEVESLRNYCLTIKGKFKNHLPKGIYLASLVSCAYETGFRLADQLSIERDWIVNQNGTWALSVVEQKTGKIARRALTDDTMFLVQQLIAASPNSKLVWPLWARREQFFELFRRVVKDSKIRKGTFKFLRRTAATVVEKQERGNGQRFLNHSSSQVTQDSYLDASQIESSLLRVPPLAQWPAVMQDTVFTSPIPPAREAI